VELVTLRRPAIKQGRLLCRGSSRSLEELDGGCVDDVGLVQNSRTARHEHAAIVLSCDKDARIGFLGCIPHGLQVAEEQVVEGELISPDLEILYNVAGAPRVAQRFPEAPSSSEARLRSVTVTGAPKKAFQFPETPFA
jgi:hypothetical protein